MKYKLIVMDIDGTVLKSNHNVSRKSIKVLQTAREKGLITTLASGRNYSNMLHIAEKLSIREPLISSDGAFIKNPSSGKIHHMVSFDVESIIIVLKMMEDHGLHYTVHFEHGSISNRKVNYLSFVKRMGLRAISAGIYEKGIMETMKYDHMIEKILKGYLKPLKITTMANDPNDLNLEAVSEKIKINFKNTMRVSYSGLKNFELLPGGVSKAIALEVIEEIYGVSSSEVIAFGDSFNDLEMIERAGLGIAMGNASENVKKTADFVTKSNDLHGVAYAIEQFVLKD
ncbi:Cof-type HAD-IIB family hydrolase [Alkalibacter mobilis]|uniref:Cof-type HAD-IIB family hydrolase n=1 Tax=Alkalibacter mobilis TaxID=2787712 RepID=UPI00189EE5D9|nr:Cof-type HAD-IIB family hydrolase [Alkalibacter mobilis]MBF7095740.1 HAD family phosphatase [Alkalibacter mobilis]